MVRRVTLHRQVVFEEGGDTGIFPSSRAYMEETERRMTPRQQAVFEGGGETRIF